MDHVLSIMAGLGLAAACGFRVFLPMLVAGLAIHSGHLTPGADFAWLGSTPALVALGIATGLEIAGYYIPWFDHALDSVASPAAVVAGTVLLASFAVDLDPYLRWTLAVIAGGGVAATVQAGTVAARGLSLSTSGGIANPLVSTAELGGALITSATAVVAPGFAVIGVLGLVLLAVTFWMRNRARQGTKARA